jgi:hypothetical protein
MLPLVLSALLPPALAHDGAPVPGPGAHAAHATLATRPLGLSRPSGPPPAPPADPPDKVVYGYLPYWTVGPDEVPWAHLTHLAIFNVDLESDGSVSSQSRWTGVAREAVSLGHAAGVKVHLCITSFDGDVMDAVLASPSRRAVTIDALAELVETYGADGVNVDFEGLPVARRADLVTFVTELRARVGEVWLATPAVDWNDAWDYPALAAASDGLFIMGYAYHYTGGGAGPNSPLSAGDLWSRWALDWTVADYLATGAPADKIVLGLPTYGQEWPVADATGVPADTTDDGWSVVYSTAVADAATYGRAYDAGSDTPWYASSSTRQAWYDDADSLSVKMEWAVDQGLAGFGFWAIGYDGNDPVLWAAVDAASHLPEDTGPGTTDSDLPEDTDRPRRPPKGQVLEEAAGCACDAGGGLRGGALLGASALLLARRRRQ